MKITFCGGAGEVGASCYLLHIDEYNILLDCGVRMGNTREPLPDFRLIQEQGGIDAILVSHAHMDHTGSLPIISREYPEARIYMTHATKDLVRVLLYDSLKIMGSRETEIPVYGKAHVEGMLGRIVCYSPNFTFEPLPGIRVTLYQAGHIAGAACIYIQGQEGSLFYSGDLSLFRQNSIEGAAVPKLRPDAAILESTYGDKLHGNREIEEMRLIDTVRAVIERNGKILIPAFALGRAQEVILILKRAMNRGLLPKSRVYVDGLVREICRVYRLNPNYLRNSLARRVWRGRDVFFEDERVIPVTDMKHREAILAEKEPCCIISSSGMLSGGPSQWYAERLAGDEKNFIAITGYQDEESPGRMLLNLAEAEERILQLEERKIPVKCGIGKYGLSAHADRQEITNLVNRIIPRRVVLVHGEDGPMEELARSLQREIQGQVYIASNGETLPFYFRNPRKQRFKEQLISLHKGTLPDSEDLKELHGIILDQYGTAKGFTTEELLYMWSGRREFMGEEIRECLQLLNDSRYFEPEMKRPFLFHGISPEALCPEEEGVMEMNEALAVVDELFPPGSGIFKRGAQQDRKILLLSFDFPSVARVKYGEPLKELENRTGWGVKIKDEIRLEAVEDVIRRVLPPDVKLKGKVSYYRNEGKVRITPAEDIHEPSCLVGAFREATGLELEIVKKSEAGPRVPPVASHDQMEQNAAFSLIEEAFRDKPHTLYKKSLKRDDQGAYIELAFISPEIGSRYRQLLDRLEEQSRWSIRINPAANMNEMIKLTRRLLEDKGIFLTRNPSFLERERCLRISLRGQESVEDLMEIKEKFFDLTGYQLVW